MTDQWTDRLSEYLDGELPDAERTALEQHLGSCADCRAAVLDLRRVVRWAREAPSAEPGNLWPDIAARIGAVSPKVRSLDAHRARRQVAFTLPQLATAAALLIAIAGGGAWSLARSVGTAPTAPIATTAAPSTGIALPAGLPTRAEASYNAAVADLEAALAAGRDRLSPTTVATLERNLARIDQAIAEARRALAGDPANAYLNSHLATTMQQKLDVLQQAATLARAQS